jgi:hypothetical protein
MQFDVRLPEDTSQVCLRSASFGPSPSRIGLKCCLAIDRRVSLVLDSEPFLLPSARRCRRLRGRVHNDRSVHAFFATLAPANIMDVIQSTRNSHKFYCSRMLVRISYRKTYVITGILVMAEIWYLVVDGRSVSSLLGFYEPDDHVCCYLVRQRCSYARHMH